MNCLIAPLLLLLAVFSYQPPEADGAVAFDYTKDTEVKTLAEEVANDLAALVLKILEKKNEAEYPRDCTEVLARGYTLSGVYIIKPDKLDPFTVFCDQETDGGGWTVFQRRQDGSVSFNQNWREYENGFGEPEGEFWLGLSKIHRLTRWKQIPFELRVDVEDFEDNSRHVQYSRFHLDGPSNRYTLHIAGYSSSSTLDEGDLNSHNGSKFTTRDRDNDAHSPSNCAVDYSSGWWFHRCFTVNLNGVYHTTNPPPRWRGINWYPWKGHSYSLRYSEMKARPNHFKQSAQ